jgi:hypothetical protein
MARVGLIPTLRDIELIDMVGYIVLRMKWRGLTVSRAHHCQMPWFKRLHKSSHVLANWSSIRGEISALFDRIIEANLVTPAHPHAKLNAFLSAILAEADREVLLGSEHGVG